MKMKIDPRFIFLFTVLIILIGCHDSNSAECGDDYWDLGNGAQVSDCGGFEVLKKESINQSVENDCSNERLIWQYDQESQSVRFLNKDVWLNCCGDHSITISMDKETGVYMIDETDRPESGNSRCKCMCFYDFKVDLPDIALGMIQVELYRYVTDQEPRYMVWEGGLDLNKGEGDELIEENVGWCN